MFTKAILINGGGLEGNGNIHEWTKRRLDKALEIYTGNELFITLSRGTIYKPPILDTKGFPIYESSAAAKYLLQQRIKPENIRMETQSLDTIGNAYFAKAIFLEPIEIKNFIVITSSFHMPRTKFIYQWIYHLDAQRKYQLEFVEVSDEGLDSKIIQARIEKEKKRLEETKKIAARIKDEKAFNTWLFTQHKAYALGTFAEDTLDEMTIKTY